jgi:capsular polysaccharide export protein
MSPTTWPESPTPSCSTEYRTHAPVNAAVEYAGISDAFRCCAAAAEDKALIDGLVARRVPFYLLPLQLSSDAQIRDHSRFDDMNGVMEFVLESFAGMRRARRGW